ncbi:MAG: 4-alpha-glucanotransferase [Phycisphaerales bacterium]|nr:4-alpha-glucanotransferase [Phycisphaerales bacterium]
MNPRPRSAPPLLSRRSAGILLHPTSLPGPHGVGDLGRAAHGFVDFLAAAGMTWWQMLPITPPDRVGAPYSSDSAFAGSPMLISLDALVEDGLLNRDEIRAPRALDDAPQARYPAALAFRTRALRRAFRAFSARNGDTRRQFDSFCARHAHWLDSDALYRALFEESDGKNWFRWPAALRAATRSARAQARRRLAERVDYHRFVQFEFDRQWRSLRSHCAARGVRLMGDIPIFVAYDSSDVWARQELFTLSRDGRRKWQTGVPPDDFNRNGQLWEHPLYDWSAHRKEHFAWWIARFRHTLEQFDAVRIDHFLGFARCWAVPGHHRTALRGRWQPAPGRELFDAVRSELGRPEVIAEDLGEVTPEAIALRERYGFPGMRILHWAFNPGAAYHQPHNFPAESVVYTGTHDNDTTVGWWKSLQETERRLRGKLKGRPKGEATGKECEVEKGEVLSRMSGLKRSETRGRMSGMEKGVAQGSAGGDPQLTTTARARAYMNTDAREIHWDMIRLAMASPANTAIIPLQDVLGLDTRHRMNIPGTPRGNWHWRFDAGELRESHARRLRSLAETYGRLPSRGD